MGRLNSSVNDLVLVHLLVSHEQLSIDSAFSGRAARELARLYSIPPASVAAWSAATGYPTIDAAFSLLKVQPLFSVDAFQQARFETALPLARQRPMAASALVQSASSELPNSGTLNDIAVGQTINGRLSESDPLYPDTTYYQRWQFTPREGQDVTIDLSSSEFDPVLIVRGLVNDDGGPGCASRVAFTARGSGAVTILVNTTSDPTRQTGAFTLSVSPTRKPVDPPGTRDCQPGNRRENMRETPERL
jgi:hypothetical protein